MSQWGFHLSLDCSSCNIGKITSAENISNFAKELVRNIDMKAYGEPQVVHFGEGNKAGYTLIQLIETSNIAGHFCDDSGDVYLDVFSCKKFDPNIVADTVETYFNPTSIKMNFLHRNAASNGDCPAGSYDFP